MRLALHWAWSFLSCLPCAFGCGRRARDRFPGRCSSDGPELWTRVGDEHRLRIRPAKLSLRSPEKLDFASTRSPPRLFERKRRYCQYSK